MITRRDFLGTGAALAVANIDKDQPSQIAPGMDPAGQSGRLPDLCRAQLVAMIRSFHEIAFSLTASFVDEAKRRLWGLEPWIESKFAV